MYGNRISKQPSHYPPLAFHILRLGQLLSSLIVAIVLSFFVHHLKVERYTIPWTFLLVRKPGSPSYHLSHQVNIPAAPHCLHPYTGRPYLHQHSLPLPHSFSKTQPLQQYLPLCPLGARSLFSDLESQLHARPPLQPRNMEEYCWHHGL